MDEKIAEFKQELTALLNKHSVDNACLTPDYILAEMVVRWLWAYHKTMFELSELVVPETEKKDVNTQV